MDQEQEPLFRILKLLHDGGRHSAIAISGSTGLSLVTIRGYLAPLIRSGQVIEHRTAPGKGKKGRPGASISEYGLPK